MSEEGVWQLFWHVLERTWGALLALCGVIGAYLIWLGQRVIHLDKAKLETNDLGPALEAMKTDFEKCTTELSGSIKELVTQRRADNAEIFGALRTSVDRQSETNVQLTEALGELRGEMRARRSAGGS